MRRIAWVLLLAIAPFVARSQAELPDAAAATEIIENLQGTLGNLSTVLSLPPERRVDWVLNKASDSVQKKIVENAKTQVKEAMDNYAKAAFRAQAFKTIAIPALKNAALFKTPVNWELLQSQMNSKVDTKIAAYGVATAGVAIVWDSVEAFSEGGAQAGFSKMAAGVYEAVADAYIPGWGWFRLGITMVEGLGNYVLGYATDTATAGMLNDMFNMKGNPTGFAQMLRTTPLSKLNQIVDDDWELVGYGRVWPGKGSDEGNDAQKQRLKDTLYNLKAGVAHEYAVQQQKDAALRAAFQPHLDAAAQAEDQLKAVASKVTSDAKPLLAATRDFQRRRNELWKEKSVEDAHINNTQLAAPPQWPEWPYTPVPRGGYLSQVEACWGRFQESMGGSFDEQAFYDDQAAIRATWTQLFNAQIPPPDIYTDPPRDRPMWFARRDYDFQALGAEGGAIVYAARQREAIMAEAIAQEIKRLVAQRNEHSERTEQGLLALENEAAETLRLPDTFRRFSQPGTLDYTPIWLFNQQVIPGQSITADNYVRLAPYLDKLEADAEVLPSLNSRRRKLYADYATFLTTVEARMETIIPQGCLVVSNRTLGSEGLVRTWSSSYHFGGLVLELSVNSVRPELTESDWFDSKVAIDAVKVKLAELEGVHDRWQLQSALQRVTQMLDQKLQPFTAANAGGLVIAGRVNGILDYRKPLEQTDLYHYIQRFESVWLAAQTRIELLQRHPTLIDASPYLQYGTRLNLYRSTLNSDQDERQRAPAQAALLKSTVFQPGIDRWTPILKEMTPSYYEDAIGGLGGLLAGAEGGYLRARAASTPTYALMEDYFRNYISQVTNLLQQAQAEYTRIIPWYWETMPSITSGTNKVNRTVGQEVNFAFQTSEPGGTYSVFFLPAGLSLDPATGSISGKITQAGDFEVPVRYQAPSGVSTHSIVHLGVEPPAGTAQTLTINNGTPELRLQGVPGLNYLVQVLDGLEGENRWVTVRTLTLGKDQVWVDGEGMPGRQRFYRLVWVQPSL